MNADHPIALAMIAIAVVWLLSGPIAEAVARFAMWREMNALDDAWATIPRDDFYLDPDTDARFLAGIVAELERGETA